MTTPTQAQILQSLALNAVARIESDLRVLNGMQGFTPSPEITVFYEKKIESLQKFLKALSFSNEVDVELCEILEKEDYVVVAQSMDNELTELMKSIKAVEFNLYKINPANAVTALESDYNNYYTMLQAKTDFYDLYNKVRFD